MKKVLVTGAGGFIGSHLAETLVAQGHNVRALVKYNSRNDWGWLEQSKYRKDIEIVTGDIRNYDSVHDAMNGCDTVFHLAALIGIPYSYVSPLAYIRTNVEGSYNVLQVAKELSTDGILLTSTSETYGTAQYVPIDEKHPQVGQSPYSASKIAADQLAISYSRSFGLPVKIVRPFNTYGPRQSARAIIPTVIVQILSGTKSIRLGNLHPTRDLTYVKDTVNGFIEIAKCDKLIGEVTNIGMNEEESIGDLVTLIAELMDAQIDIETEADRIRGAASEVERLRCDNKKLMASSSWTPEHDLKRGLRETIEWFRHNHAAYKASVYNV
jgi:NAD dependent epimerase/dehydratase